MARIRLRPYLRISASRYGVAGSLFSFSQPQAVRGLGFGLRPTTKSFGPEHCERRKAPTRPPRFVSPGPESFSIGNGSACRVIGVRRFVSTRISGRRLGKVVGRVLREEIKRRQRDAEPLSIA